MDFINAKIKPYSNGFYIIDIPRGVTYFAESYDDSVKCARCIDEYYRVTAR